MPLKIVKHARTNAPATTPQISSMGDNDSVPEPSVPPVAQICQDVRRAKLEGCRFGPAGQCFDWNLGLAVELRRHGYQPQFISGNFQTDHKGKMPHYWVELDDHILDLTASQYDTLCDTTFPKIHNIAKDDPQAARYQDPQDQTGRLKFWT